MAIARLNIRRLTKTEINWLWTHHCKKHGHKYLEHWPCFIKDYPQGIDLGTPDGLLREEIGFFDIETTDLNAEFGILMSYRMKKLDGPILGRVLTPKEILGDDLDRKIVKECVRDINKFDRLIVHWGKDRRFDMPFIRSRALFWNIDFPGYKDLWVQDTFDMVKQKMCLRKTGRWGSTGKLSIACDFLDIPAKHYPMKPKVWMRALQGSTKKKHCVTLPDGKVVTPLKYILLHNTEDVESTEALWKRLEKFVRRSKTSI